MIRLGEIRTFTPARELRLFLRKSIRKGRFIVISNDLKEFNSCENSNSKIYSLICSSFRCRDV